MVCCVGWVWMSFYDARTLTRSLEESDGDWPLSPRCSLARVHVMREGLSGIVVAQ